MEEIKVAEVENANVEASPAEKAGLGTRISESRPVKGLKKHWKGAVAGVAAAVAVIGAAAVAAKAANEGVIEPPFDVDGITSKIPVPDIPGNED